MSAAPVTRRVRRALARWRSDGVGPGVVVAVSGGSDSVGLLRAMAEVGPGLGLVLTVAHLDHGTRGEAAAADSRFVAGLAERLGLPVELGQWSPVRPAHFEADARRARYDWLVEVARRSGANAVAVGHTRDDQAETVLHRVLRGTGPRGLAGIPPRRRLAEGVVLIRPLLSTSRADVRCYLETLHQNWREDHTNADLRRTRSRLRHDLLPKLADEYNPRVVEALARLAALSRSSVRSTDARVDALAAAAIAESGSGRIALRLEPLAGLPVSERAEVIRAAWRAAGWPESTMTADRWRRLARSAGRPGRSRFAVGGGVEAQVEPSVLVLSRVAEPSPFRGDPPPPVVLPLPGVATWGDRRIVAVIGDDPGADEAIDLDALDPFSDPPHLIVGPLEAGERFVPLGEEGRARRLRSFLARRVGADDRDRVPIVRDRRGIVWVVGHRIADRVRRTEGTRRVLSLRSESARGDGG